MRFFTYVFSMNQPDSTAKNMPKIAKVKLSSCGLEVADLKLRTSEKIAIVEMQSCGCGATLKCCEIAIAEGLPSSCGIAIADSKKVVRVHL